MLEYYHYLVLKNNYDTNFYTIIKQGRLSEIQAKIFLLKSLCRKIKKTKFAHF